MKKIKLVLLIVITIVLVVITGLLIGLAIHGNIYNKNAKNPIVILDISGYGEVQIELYPEYAPNTVATIVKLIQNKYYDGKVFYGVGDTAVHFGMIRNETTIEEGAESVEAESTSTEYNAIEDIVTLSDIDLSVPSGGEKDINISIKGEFVANGYERNTLRFEKGTVGLFRPTYTPYDETNLTEESYNSGNSLWFISTAENSSLNGLYAPFGKVIKGYDIIEKISNLKVIENEEEMEGTINFFESLPTITKATVETFGINYGMPIYQEAFDYNAYCTEVLFQYYQP